MERIFEYLNLEFLNKILNFGVTAAAAAANIFTFHHLSISGENQRRHNYERGNGNDVFSAPCLPEFQGLLKNIQVENHLFCHVSTYINGLIFEKLKFKLGSPFRKNLKK